MYVTCIQVVLPNVKKSKRYTCWITMLNYKFVSFYLGTNCTARRISIKVINIEKH